MTLRSLALLAALAAWPATAQDAGNGAALYAEHCATCHGARADGLGPRAPSLNPQPADLTALRATNGGEFPLLRVVRRIDGRDPLVSHGSPMPVFGPYFSGERAVAIKTAAGQPVLMAQTVADLVLYLMEIQK